MGGPPTAAAAAAGEAQQPTPVARCGWGAELNDITEVIASCADDMKAIWEDPMLRSALAKRNVRLEETPGFFLNDVERIATRHYQPTDADVIRARLRMRAAWYSSFDDMNAIIFLAPISCFDEKLVEDRRMNRLEDSYLLWQAVCVRKWQAVCARKWQAVCARKWLAHAQMILFLYKCDILDSKLRRGVRIRDSVPSFGDRKNDLPTATKYSCRSIPFRFASFLIVSRLPSQDFQHIGLRFAPSELMVSMRKDTESTAVTLSTVEEIILRDHLRHAELM